MAVGKFSLWQLAGFHCGSWQFFIVAIGRILQEMLRLIADGDEGGGGDTQLNNLNNTILQKNLISQTIFPIEIRFSNKI
ncbi:MAG: hypothetical protein IKX13_08455 [Bacteroidales bacterium]|nr:hypothetical protein [Bacteroidales bacterium]